jgi:hypothetical protein
MIRKRRKTTMGFGRNLIKWFLVVFLNPRTAPSRVSKSMVKKHRSGKSWSEKAGQKNQWWDLEETLSNGFWWCFSNLHRSYNGYNPTAYLHSEFLYKPIFPSLLPHMHCHLFMLLLGVLVYGVCFLVDLYFHREGFICW